MTFLCLTNEHCNVIEILLSKEKLMFQLVFKILCNILSTFSHFIKSFPTYYCVFLILQTIFFTFENGYVAFISITAIFKKAKIFIRQLLHQS